jgi:hypothetical protein
LTGLPHIKNKFQPKLHLPRSAGRKHLPSEIEVPRFGNVRVLCETGIEGVSARAIHNSARAIHNADTRVAEDEWRENCKSHRIEPKSALG